jgi:hypothetical protein
MFEMALYGSIGAATMRDAALSVSVAGSANYTLTPDHLTARHIKFTGAITANIEVLFPLVAADHGTWWIIENATTGSFTLTCKVSGQTGVAVTQGKRALLMCRYDGSSVTDVAAVLTAPAASGFAASGANTDITSLAGITNGITALNGLNLGDGLGGVAASSKPFKFTVCDKTVDSDSSTTLAAADYACPIINLSGTPGAAYEVIFPAVAGTVWIVFNNATTYDVTCKTAAGTGIVIPNGKVGIIRGDGTNIVNAFGHMPSLSIGGAGTAITQIRVYSCSTGSDTEVSADTTEEHTYACTGLTTADDLIVNKPSHQSGLGIVNARVSAPDTLAITWMNATGSGITPATENLVVIAIRS